MGALGQLRESPGSHSIPSSGHSLPDREQPVPPVQQVECVERHHVSPLVSSVAHEYERRAHAGALGDHGGYPELVGVTGGGHPPIAPRLPINHQGLPVALREVVEGGRYIPWTERRSGLAVDLAAVAEEPHGLCAHVVGECRLLANYRLQRRREPNGVEDRTYLLRGAFQCRMHFLPGGGGLGQPANTRERRATWTLCGQVQLRCRREGQD